MIETALVFALGALTAGLVALALFPAFTGRAARLARRQAEARLPMSLADIAAGKDAIRAEYAARTAKVEADLRLMRQRLVEERLSRSAEQAEFAGFRSERAALLERATEAEARIEALRQDVARAEEALARSVGDRRDLEHRFAAETSRGQEAEDRAGDAERLATDMRVALVAAEAQVVTLTERVADLEEALGRVRGRGDAVDGAAVHDGVPKGSAPNGPTGRTGDDGAIRTIDLTANRAPRGEPLFSAGRERFGERPVPEVRPPTEADAEEFGIARPQPALAETLAAASPFATDVTASGRGEAEAADDQLRVEDLARRLKTLRHRNASARGRRDPGPIVPAETAEAAGSRDEPA